MLSICMDVPRDLQLGGSTMYHVRRRWLRGRVARVSISPPQDQSNIALPKISTLNNTMARAESSKDAENNGVKANAQGAPSNYELPW